MSLMDLGGLDATFLLMISSKQLREIILSLITNSPLKCLIMERTFLLPINLSNI